MGQSVTSLPKPSEETPSDWFHCRDILLGINHKSRNVAFGVQLSRQCHHEDAKWLVALLDSQEEEQGLLLEERLMSALEKSNDKRALCFLALLLPSSADWDERRAELLLKSAMQGCALAQAHVATLGRDESDEQSFIWAQNAANMGEPLGMLVLSHCLRFGVGCQVDRAGANAALLMAAKAGNVSACYDFALRMSSFQREHFHWMHRAAVSGHVKAMKYLAKEAKSLHSEYTSLPQVYGEAVFTLGELLAKHGPPIEFTRTNTSLKAVKWLLEMHQEFCEDAKKQVRCWVLVASRLRQQGIRALCRDIVLVIASKVWDARREALFVPEAGKKIGAFHWRASSAHQWRKATKLLLGIDSVPQNIRRGIELSRQCSCDSGMRFARLIGEEKKDFTAEELKVKLLSCRDRSFKADSLALAAMMVVPHDRQLLQHAAFGNSALAIGQIAMEALLGNHGVVALTMAQRGAAMLDPTATLVLAICWNNDHRQKKVAKALFAAVQKLD